MPTSTSATGRHRDTPEEIIDRLVNEMADTDGSDELDARPELSTLADRLTQLRESSEAPPASLDTEPARASESLVPTVPAPPGGRQRQATARSGRRSSADIDAVILEAARSAGVEAAYLDDKRIPRQRRARPRKRGRYLSFYLVWLLLLAFCYALFVLYRPVIEKVVVRPDPQLASASTPRRCDIDAVSCARQGPISTSLTVPPSQSGPAVVATQSAPFPELPVIYRNERVVKTYKVGADGKIVFNPEIN